MKRAIFPLPLFILPGGYTRLRIFEKRYLTMVKNALKDDSGFVLCTFEHNTPLNVSKYGCLVDIIDFDQDENGLLLIDIYARQSVEIVNTYLGDEQLRFASVSLSDEPKWYNNTKEIALTDMPLADSLKGVFMDNPELSSLYRNTEFNQLSWVVARWLEIIPISIDKKQQLAFKSHFDNLRNFLHTVVNE
ncbi:LON peptidase substrate-binding domain-containing protein [Pseudoalteromonas sp. MMG010]|uniref:LON peptidase substrate-binding domain-containing protein n=1 Tax=Pseudoalteromonas sp. MMG010 TaxID=2822685 RepID=UPI001B39F98C|nr:LON peptidase substrate-binding domain-containing protein [Pseudoalteromonas sp. MMG010]MBQ4833431.1 LON peptidase substrate-binding domain-containing protein [Pseudoalteromonas sp. MMG010]